MLVAVDSNDSRNIQNEKIDELLEETNESKKFDCLSYFNVRYFVQAMFSEIRSEVVHISNDNK